MTTWLGIGSASTFDFKARNWPCLKVRLEGKRRELLKCRHLQLFVIDRHLRACRHRSSAPDLQAKKSMAHSMYRMGVTYRGTPTGEYDTNYDAWQVRPRYQHVLPCMHHACPRLHRCKLYVMFSVCVCERKGVHVGKLPQPICSKHWSEVFWSTVFQVQGSVIPSPTSRVLGPWYQDVA